MTPIAVVVFDVLHNIFFSLFIRCIKSLRHPFRFKAPKAAFHRGIIPTVAATTHTLLNLITPKLCSGLINPYQLLRLQIPLHNTRLIERFQELEAFNNEDQETVVKLIDAMIAKQRVENAMKPI